MSTRMTRREMLRYVGLGSAAAVLAACAPKVVKETVIVEKPVEKVVEKVIKETVIVAGTPKVVEKVVKETVVVEKGKDIFQGDLILWHRFGNTGGGGLAMLDQVEEFSKLHPNVKMTNVWDAVQDKVLPALASGNVPDLLLVFAHYLPQYAARGVLMDLNPLVDRDNWDLSQYFDFAVEQCSWQGRLYAMTHHPDIRLLYHNTEAFKEVGLDASQEAKSWDELYEWGVALSKQENDRYVRFGFVPSWIPNIWPIAYMAMNDVALISDDGHTIAFDTEQAVEAVSWVLKAIEGISGGYENVAEFIEMNPTPTGEKGAYWMFPYGRTAIQPQGNWQTFSISQVNPDLEIELSRYPAGPSSSESKFIIGGGTMISIPTGAKHWELAWEWLKFLGGPVGAGLVQKRTADISGRIETARDPQVLSAHLKRAEMIDLFESANALHYVMSPISRQFDDECQRMGERILLKEMTPSEAVSVAASELQRALDEYWATA